MPDSSKIAVLIHLGHATIEEREREREREREASPCSCCPGTTPEARSLIEPPQQAEDKGKDVAEVDAGVIDEASASSSSSKELKEKKQSEDGAKINLEVQAYLQKRDQRLFRDRPDQADLTSGLGLLMSMHLMGLPEAADHLQVNEPPMGIGVTRAPPVTYCVATFGAANDGGGRVLIPFLETNQVEDPEQLGFDGLLQ